MWHNIESHGEENGNWKSKLRFTLCKNNNSELVCDHWKLFWLFASPPTTHTHTRELTHNHRVEILKSKTHVRSFNAQTRCCSLSHQSSSILTLMIFIIYLPTLFLDHPTVKTTLSHLTGRQLYSRQLNTEEKTATAAVRSDPDCSHFHLPLEKYPAF